MNSNIVQHYGTWLKKDCKELGRGRINTLSLNGFKGTPHTLIKLEDGSPIQRARELADKMMQSYEFDCKAIHLVLLDCKSMDNLTGYVVYRKLIK
ncbi:hypothetical protein [Vibrio sp. Hal054]|uniref:hypothetical protein n=1 Tax=Vibrio sp. Hal054 TaxID=3035158 RepID=UPI00301DCAF5